MMISKIYQELSRTKEEELRLQLLMTEIRSILDAKSKRSILDKVKKLHPKTQPKGWN